METIMVRVLQRLGVQASMHYAALVSRKSPFLQTERTLYSSTRKVGGQHVVVFPIVMPTRDSTPVLDLCLIHEFLEYTTLKVGRVLANYATLSSTWRAFFV